MCLGRITPQLGSSASRGHACLHCKSCVSAQANSTTIHTWMPGVSRGSNVVFILADEQRHNVIGSGNRASRRAPLTVKTPAHLRLMTINQEPFVTRPIPFDGGSLCQAVERGEIKMMGGLERFVRDLEVRFQQRFASFVVLYFRPLRSNIIKGTVRTLQSVSQ